MSWLPFVSRLAYEVVVSERDRLRTKNDQWEEHVRRVERKTAGMPELPLEKREPADLLVPSRVLRLINRFDNEAIRRGMRNDVLIAKNRGGKAWSEIEAELKAALK